MKKSNKFVNAVKAKGGAVHLGLGGGISVRPKAPTVLLPGGQVTANTTNGGIVGGLTPQTGYTAQLAPQTNVNYVPAISQATGQALSGYGAYNENMNAEKALQGTLNQEIAGEGPNPAQNALAQNTAQNVAAQNALAAGVRGSSANAGLIAREAAQQGAATQQQAVGQEATLEAEQRLAAQAQQAALTGQVGGQITAEQAANNQLLGVTSGANTAQNAAAINNYGQAQATNAQIATGNAAASQRTAGGILGGLGSVAGFLGSIIGLAEGGEVPDKDDNDSPTTLPAIPSNVKDLGDNPLSKAGAFLKEFGKSLMPPTPGPQAPQPTFKIPTFMAKGGKAKEPFTAGKGKVVPGKAKTPKDDTKNDTVPAMLSPGEIVLPKSVSEHPDAPKMAAQFVAAIKAKQGLKRK